MHSFDDKISEFAKEVEKSFAALTLKNVVFAMPKEKGEVLKIKGTPKKVSDTVILQLEYFCTEGRVRQENIKPERVFEKTAQCAEGFQRCELNDAGGSASLMVSKKGKITLLRRGSVGVGAPVQPAGDKEKNYILSGGEEFLYYLGISDKNGRVHDKKQSKFRQINRFLEHVEDITRRLATCGTLRVADLCCGKSYLSFAVYYYLTSVCKRDVIMDCVDLKESVMEYCSDIAAKCGFDGMRFSCGDVSKYAPEAPPELVISLHACDVATDIVLERAAALGAKVILATPCCHRQLSRELKCPELDFIAENSVLKSKFCDAATDALRVLRLRACGYIADAVELIDPEDTPKNVLIRAWLPNGLTYKKKKLAALDEYRRAYKFLCGRDAPDIDTEV